jgi:DNA mismatch repair protein MutS
MKPAKATPMIKQYLTIKGEYPDAILFYRMGDFYEMFFEDAEVASRALEITLTSRNKNDAKPVPMCGVPHRAAQSYIARLIDQGYKVAICDQVEDPAQAKGLVKREVVRVITPGMLIENELLNAKSNNYVLATTVYKQRVGLAFLDLSTGQFRATEARDSASVADECLRIAPSEIILPENMAQRPELQPVLGALADRAVTHVPDNVFDLTRARERLLDQFQTLSLEGFGIETQKAALIAAGALLHYVRETQKQRVTHIHSLSTYSLGNHLVIDDSSCRNLELAENLRTRGPKGTLTAVLDRTITAMGGRLLKEWLRYPLLEPARIEQRLTATAAAKQLRPTRLALREQLKSVFDLERLNSKITMGHANGRDLIALKTSLQSLPTLHSTLAEFEASLLQWETDLDPLVQLSDLIEAAIREDAPPTIQDGGVIKHGFDPALDELIDISRDGKSWLAALETRERDATGINTLKVRYNKVFGYYIEISKTRSDDVPAHYIRKQTLVNAERFITDELKTFEAKVLGAEERRAALEYQLFNQVRHEVTQQSRLIQQTAAFLAQVDCILGLATVAEDNDYTQPALTTERSIVIEDGRHPVVEKMLTGERFVPNSIQIDNAENQVLIITGPNMAGKSTFLRQVALTAIMTQMGSFVPARKATMGIVDRIFTRVGALDNLSQGQSTFMVEMEETANILNHATAQSLVIMDEIGRGTSTFDGMSIAWAVAEHLHDLHGEGVKTLFATHYHELTELAHSKPRVKNFNIAVKEWNDEIIFLRKLVEGGTNRSYGIQVARLAGIPAPVIRRSKQILFKIENGTHTFQTPADDQKGSAAQESGPVQLDLFGRLERKIAERIASVDLSHMTPLEALNLLSRLQDETKSVIE